MGGYVTEALGIKWMFIIIASKLQPSIDLIPSSRIVTVMCAASSAIGIPLLRETYAPVVRWRLAKKRGDMEAAARLDPSVLAVKGGSKGRIIWQNLSRPIVLLTRSYVCFTLSLYQALYVRRHHFSETKRSDIVLQ